MNLLEVNKLSASLNRRPILNDISFAMGAGECVGLIGPNGAGKSTLMRAVLGLIAHKGESALAAMPPKARARHVVWMPQSREIVWPLSVENVVALGRIPHMSAGMKPSAEDQGYIDRAIDEMDLSAMRSRPANQLSGGEQARVLIARALAQDTPLVFVDEPIAGLDPAHQISTMQSFRALADAKKSVLISMHDLGLAARYCTRLILLADGKIHADGAPADVLTEENLRNVFGIRAYAQHTEAGFIFQALEAL